MTTFIVAVDGASPKLTNRWMDEGKLKNFEKFRSRGLSGKLKSTFPPLTGPAWSSFHTGVNPGKHGVYSWIDLRNSYEGRIINGDSIKTRTIWKQISSQGGKVGLLSVPVTYPPEEVDGFVVPGFLTPTSATHHTYPASISTELFNTVPDYTHLPEPFMKGKDPKQWVSSLKKTIRDRGKAARYLYKNHFEQKDKETLMIHFFATDQVQHYLWDHVSDDWDPRLEIFQEVDCEIGKLIELAPDDSTFIILSDHGFGPLEGTFNINTWLESEGLLKLNKNIGTGIKKHLAKFGFTEQNTRPIGEAIYPLAKKLKIVDNPITGLSTNKALNSLFLSSKDVDWKCTSAYSRSHIGHIRLNVIGREKTGSVKKSNYRKLRDDIMKKLSRIKPPMSDKTMADWVKPKEDIYSGPYLEGAPDILFNPLEGKDCQGGILGYGAVMFLNSSVFSKKLHPAHHRREGILMAYGKDIKNTRKDASIMDLAPTILNLNSLKIPKQMDGEVIKEIAPAEPRYFAPDSFYKDSVGAKQDREIKERMRSLGYL